MKKRHWGLFLFLVLMIAMLLGGIAIFADAVLHPASVPPWKLVLGRLG